MKPIHIIYLFVLISISCSKKIDLASYINPTQAFQVTDFERAKGSDNEMEIQVKDSKHGQLLSWIESNKKNWKSTQHSYASLFIISQENFRMLLYRNNDIVVVKFTDEKNVSHQYIKDINPGELDFLDEE